MHSPSLQALRHLLLAWALALGALPALAAEAPGPSPEPLRLHGLAKLWGEVRLAEDLRKVQAVVAPYRGPVVTLIDERTLSQAESTCLFSEAEVRPTLEGLRAGRDEVLEAALQRLEKVP